MFRSITSVTQLPPCSGKRLGHHGDDLDRLLDDWAGSANFEMRLRPGKIDPVVLEQLRLGRT